MHNFVLINQISFIVLVLIGFSFDSIDRGMDLIVLNWFELNTLLISFLNLSCFWYSNFEHSQCLDSNWLYSIRYGWQ
jgi:hypothetical protein